MADPGARVKLCVIGAGSHSTGLHGPALARLRAEGMVELCGICDLDRDRAEAYQRRFGFRAAYTDGAAMLGRESPDGMLLITAISVTESLARLLIPHRIPLLIEKPPGENGDAAHRIACLARQHGTPVMVSLNRRFSPALVRARDGFRSRVSSGPVRVDARMCRVNRMEDRFVSQTGIHTIDAALSLIGDPVRFTVRSRSRGGVFTAVRIAAESGDACHVFIAPRAGVQEETYRLSAGGARARADVVRHEAWGEEPGQPSWRWRLDTDGRMENSKQPDVDAETRAFVESLQGRRPFHPDVEVSERSLRAAEAAERGGVEILDFGKGKRWMADTV